MIQLREFIALLRSFIVIKLLGLFLSPFCNLLIPLLYLVSGDPAVGIDIGRFGSVYWHIKVIRPC